MPHPRTRLIVAMVILAAGFPAAAAAQQQSPTVGLAAQTDTGTRPYIPYDGAAENINLTNGNVNLKVPLIHLPGRNGFDLDLHLEYDSKVWKLEAGYDSEANLLEGAWREDIRWPYVAMGWHLNIPMINYTSQLLYTSSGLQYGCTGTTTVILSDGSRHNFSNNPGCPAPYQINVMDSEDNSGAILTLGTPDGTVLALRNGVKIYFPTTVTGVASKMVDANGNIITFNTTQNGTVLTSITDTLGRTILFNNGSSYYWCSQIPGWGLNSITYPDPNAPGGTFTVSFGYTSTTLNWYHSIPFTDWKAQPPVFVSGRTGTSNRNMLTSVNVGGHVFSFEYGLSGSYRYGELTKITYPSGGYTTYSYVAYGHFELLIPTYQANPSYYSMESDFREVSQKQACTSPTDCATTTYSSGGIVANNSSMQVVFPDGHKEVHAFTQEMIAGQGGETNHGLAAQETQVVTKSPSDVVLQTVTTTYSGTKTWDLPTSVQTQLDASGPTKKYRLDYDTFTAYYLPWLDPWVEAQPTPTTVDRKHNVTLRQEYDWGMTTLLRETQTSYVHMLNGHDYFSSGIRLMNLPATSTVYDGGGAQKAQTQYVYDDQPLTGTSGAPSHDYTNYSSSYVTRGNATQVQRWRNLPSSTWLTTYNTYDDLGNLRSSTDPGGHATTYAYADNWSGSSCLPSSNSLAYLTQVTNALNQRIQAAYFPCTGRMQSRKDENDIQAARPGTTFTYDQFSRMLTRTVPDGGQVTNVFNDTPPVTVTSTTKITSSLNLTSVALVDGLGRLKQTQLTSDPEGTVSTDTTYDGLNRTATASNPYRSTGDATYGVTTTNYDGLSRVSKVIPPDGSSSANNVSTAYSGNCSTVTDQAGKTRKSCVDGLDRLTQVFEPNASGSFLYETDYQYDPLNNLTRVDQKGNDANSANWRTRTFTYDSLSRLTQAVNPESGTVNYTYDSDGNLLTKADARSITITYGYDALHRLTGKTYSNGDPAVSYFYDQTSYNGLTIANGIGRRTGMSDASGASAWSYDIVPGTGWKTTERRTLAGVTKSIIYQNNLYGSLGTLTYPSNRVVNYTYSTAGRAILAHDVGQNIDYVSANSGSTFYWPSGALNSAKLGANITLSNGYNSRLQPTTLSATSGANTLMSRTYDFHAGASDNGNVWGITDNVDAQNISTRPIGSATFLYDNMNRITQFKTTGTDCTSLGGLKNTGNTYSIDAWGNLTNKGTVAGLTGCIAETMNEAVGLNNQFTGANRYDAAGNMTSNGAYVFDAENRITSGSGLTFKYDGDGNRVLKTGTTNELYWLGTGTDALAESDAIGNLTSEYIFFGGKRVARFDIPNSSVHYYISDHLGSATVIGSASGAVEREEMYYPYGGERWTNGSDPNHYKFTGKERDAETGLDYFGARYYGSNMGRWMSPDWATKPTPVPYADLGDPQTLNLYGYVRNNPLAKADADGHCGEDACVVETVAGITILVMATQAYYALPPSQRDFGKALSQASTSVSGTIKSWFSQSNSKPDAATQSNPAPGTQTGHSKPGDQANPAPAVPGTQTKPRSNPMTGEPGSTSQTLQPDGTPKQTRTYGQDGHPETDVDRGHDHGQGDPHGHDWGRPEDGSPPTHNDRGPGRPVKPEDPKPL